MRIGYFTARFPYKNPVTGEVIKISRDGGVENVTYNLAIQMAKKGHQVTIFTTSEDSESSVEDYGKIKIYRFGKKFKIGQAPISLDLLYKPLVIKDELDIIHSQLGNLPAPIGACVYSIVNKKKVITTYHEDYVGGFGSILRRFGVFLFDFLIADCLLYFSDVVLTPSEYYIQKSKHLKRISYKVKPIPNGINLDNFNVTYTKNEARNRLNLPINKKIILFVGSLTPRKAPDVLLNSMKLILEKFSDSYLIFVGDGYLKSELEKRATELNIFQSVDFSGFVDEKLKLFYYYSADIFVLPSFSEGFGIVLLEASACGLPLVVSSLEVFNSIVTDEYNGLFTKTGDEKDLADKILYLLQNQSLMLQMGKNSLEKVKDFSWDWVANETENVYYNLKKM